jgi:hyperosmotically inducible periplasmic protein
MKIVRRSLIPALAAVLFLVPSSVIAPHTAVVLAQSSQDTQIQASVINNALNRPRLRNVKATVHDGIVTLTGTVDLFDNKVEAERRTHRVNNVKGVDNQIQVAGPQVSDADLLNRLVRSVSLSRVGRGTTAFNAIGVNVQNGVVTLSGTAFGPVDADTAVSIAANTPGVRDVINEIAVDPVSPADDRIRRAVYNSIYNFPSFRRYAINPARPIRISVQRGHVTLFGVVNSEADRNIAGIRANTVSGVFSVTNNLMVAGQPIGQ